MGYIIERKAVTQETDVMTGCVCDNCGENLRAVSEREDGTWSAAQAEGSLDIAISGGYDQFFDADAVRLVWCRRCSEALLQAFPSVARAIESAELTIP